MVELKRIFLRNRQLGMRVLAFTLSVLLLLGTVSAPLRTYAEADMNQNAQAEAEEVLEETVDEAQVDAQTEIQEEASETDITENEALVDELAGDNSGEEVAEETLGETDEALSEAVTEEVIEESAEEVSETTDEVSAEETSEDAGSEATDSEEATEELPELTPNAGAEAVVAEEIVVDDSDIEALEEDEETDEEISEEPFYEVQVVDGIAVSVSADPGVFPEGASLFVRAVDPSEIAPAEESIDEERDDNVKVASSYTFDIKVFDAEGNEIQPDTSKGKVYVSFAMAEADNTNLSADIYHIDDELNVDKLDTETVTDSESPVVVAETEGFSYYQVEFTYGEMQYVLPGDSEVRLQEILDYLGISGNVTNVYGSNDSLFSAENRDGEWYVIAHQAFSSNEWLKVTLDGVEMDVEIVVTDEKTWKINGKDGWDWESEIPSNDQIFEIDDYLENVGSESIEVNFDNRSSVIEPGNKFSIEFLFHQPVSFSYHESHNMQYYFGNAIMYVDLDVQGGNYGKNGTNDVTTWFLRYGQLTSDFAPENLPSKEGCTFGGFFSEPNGQGTQYISAGGNSITKCYDTTITTLYAYWIVPQSTVTLNDNGGSGGSGSKTATYGSDMPTPIVLPTRTGYTFKGYYDTSASSGGTQYYTETGASKRTWNKTGPQTLYARWTANSYTVTLNRNGGTGGSDSVSATYGSAMPTATMPTYDGYEFQGYYDTQAQTGGTQYYTKTGASAGAWDKAQAATLYARWKEIATVNQAPAAVAAADRVYTGQPINLVSAGSVNNSSVSKMQYKLGDNGTWSDDIPAPTAAGTYKVYYKAVSTNDDSCVDGAEQTPITVEITKASVTVTPKPNQNKEFGDNDPTFTYTVSPSLFGNDTLGGSLAREAGEGVGTYAFNKGTLNSSNYEITFDPGNPVIEFTIVPKTAPAESAGALSDNLKPTGPNLAYTGANQPLLTAPANPPAGYTIMYSSDNGGSWSNQIPQASADGEYTVKVKYVADSNHQPFPEGSDTISYTVKITVAATIGENKYGTIEEAVEAWNTSGGTLVLQSDATLTDTIILDSDKVKTLDLNGHELTHPNDGPAINVTNGSLTVTDNSTSRNGKIESTTGPAIHAVNPYNDAVTSVTVESGTITSTAGDAIVLDADSALVINGGTIAGYKNGINATSNAVITVTGGNISGSTVAGINLSGLATATIAGGTIDADPAGILAQENSTVYVTGGNIHSDDAGIALEDNADVYLTGGSVSGDNFAIASASTGDLQITGDTTVGSSGVHLETGSTIDVTNGVTTNKPIQVVAPVNSVFITSDNEGGAYAHSTEGYLDLISSFVPANGGQEYTITADGKGKVVASNPYGGLAMTKVEVDEDGNKIETQIPLSPANIEFLLPGLTAGDVVYTPAEGDNPATFAIVSGDENDSFEIPEGFTLVIPAGMEVTIGEDVTLNNNGNILNNGILTNDGTIQGSGSITNDGTGGDDGVLCNSGTITGNVSITNTNLGGINNKGEISIPKIINSGEESGIINLEKGSITSDITGDGIIINIGIITGDLTVLDNGHLDNLGEINGDISSDGKIINTGTITGDVTSSGTVYNTGKLTGDVSNLEEGIILNYNGASISGNVNNEGEFHNKGDISGDIVNNGVFENNAYYDEDDENNNQIGTVSGNVTNSGNFLNEGEISGGVTNSGDFINEGTITGDGNILNQDGGTLENDGVIDTTGQVTNDEGASLVNKEEGIISSDLYNQGTAENKGEITGNVTNNDSGKFVNDGEINGDTFNSGTFDNNGILSGEVSNSGDFVNDGNITGDNNISNSGNMINNGTIDTTGIITNHPEGVLENGEDAVITNDIDNNGTFNNQGTASGDIVNSGEVNNTGDISGDIVNQSEGELNNEGTVSGNIDNRGVVNNDEEGVISGAIKNENGASVNNNAGATISGDITNEGGTVKNDSEGTISGSIDNNGYLINKDGKVTGDVTTGNNGITITVPKDSKNDVSISEDGKITIPAGSTVTTVDENGKTKTVTLPKNASSSDMTYTFSKGDLNEIKQDKDGKTEVPAGTIITRDGEETVLEFGGVIDSKGQVTPNADPNAPQSSGDGSGNSDGSNAAGDAANTGKKPGSNTNGKKPANTTETDDKENQNADDKELADEEEADEDEEDAETSEGLTDEITSGSAREDKYGSGNVRIEVESVNEDGSVSTLTGTLHGSTESILKACLTKEELERVKAGESVVVKLVVMPLEDKVPDSDKKEIEASLGSAANAPLAIGKFIDLTVMKKIGDGDWEKVTDLNEELEITIEIDKELQADGRVFYVLRYHDGEVTSLEDQDNNPETITIKTKLFSTYAIAFIADSNAVKHGFPWWILILLLILVIIASAVTGTIIYIKNRK